MRSSGIQQASAVVSGDGVTIATVNPGASFPLDATSAMVAVEFPVRTRGRAIVRVHSTSDQTFGDGTFDHSLVLVAQRRTGIVEMLGFLGIIMGGAAPQLPLKALRDWSQIVEDLDGYTKFGVSRFNIGDVAVGTVTVTLTPLVE